VKSKIHEYQKNNNQIGIFWLLFLISKSKVVIKAQTVSLFHQDKSIIQRTPLEIQEGNRKSDIGNRADETLNKEYRKKAKMKITKNLLYWSRICWRAYNGSYSTKMSTHTSYSR
jgi:hypothetical protein